MIDQRPDETYQEALQRHIDETCHLVNVRQAEQRQRAAEARQRRQEIDAAAAIAKQKREREAERIRIIGLRYEAAVSNIAATGRHPTDALIAEFLEVDSRTIVRWRGEGYVPPR